MAKMRDLRGQRFGRLVAINPTSERTVDGGVIWRCQCDCGNIVFVRRGCLLSGATSSCGCYRRERVKRKTPRVAVQEDLIGKVFGRLTVIERADDYIYPNGNHSAKWRCRCSCDNHTIIDVNQIDLKRGDTISCGCVSSEFLTKLNTTHGKSKTRLSRVWRGMLGRCYTKTAGGYKNYGERGITVCDDWRNDFQAFYDWAMANGYDENAPFGECTIDRIDVNGNYEPSNCRWISNKEQQKNKRKKI